MLWSLTIARQRFLSTPTPDLVRLRGNCEQGVCGRGPGLLVRIPVNISIRDLLPMKKFFRFREKRKTDDSHSHFSELSNISMASTAPSLSTDGGYHLRD